MPDLDSLPLAAVAATAAAVVLCLVLLLVARRLRQRPGRSLSARPAPGAARAGRSPRADPREGQALLERYHPSAVRVLTTCEREAYDLVRAALPSHLVMAQVPLVRYLRVHDKRTEDDWLRGLSMLSADILVCDATSRPLVAVEILPPNPGPKARERHDRMRHLLEGVGVRVIVWQEARLPDAEHMLKQLRTAIESEGTPASRSRTARAEAGDGSRRRTASDRIEPELGPVDAPARTPGSRNSPPPGRNAAKAAPGSSGPSSAGKASPAGSAAGSGAASGAAKAAAAATAAAAASAATGGAARSAPASGFAPLIPVPEIAELLAEGDEIAARHSRLDPVSLTFFDEFEARPQGASAAAH